MGVEHVQSQMMSEQVMLKFGSTEITTHQPLAWIAAYAKGSSHGECVRHLFFQTVIFVHSSNLNQHQEYSCDRTDQRGQKEYVQDAQADLCFRSHQYHKVTDSPNTAGSWNGRGLVAGEELVEPS